MERYNIRKATESDEAGPTGAENPAGDGKLEVENVPPLSTLLVPSQLLEAALACTGSDKARFYLNGVYVHRVKDRGRVVGSDGHRMVVAEFGLDPGADAPDWLADGVIVPNGLLKAQLSLIGKASDTLVVKLGYAVGAPKIEIGDPFGNVVFRVAPVEGQFPDYQKIIAGNVGAFDANGRGDFEPVAFNGAYLKACGDVAKILESDAVNVYACKATDAAVITFTNAPSVVLYLMPVRGEQKLGATAAALLSPAIKATLAALRAHKTRNEHDAKKAKTKGERDFLQQRADEFAARIKAVIERTNPPALPKPAEAPDEVAFGPEGQATEAAAGTTPAEPQVEITEAGRKAIEKAAAGENGKPGKRGRASQAKHGKAKKAKVRTAKATSGRKAKAKATGATNRHKKGPGAIPASIAA